MGCIAKDKMPGSKGKTILRKDKPQFVKEYKKGGDVRLLGPSETINFNKKRVTRQAKKDAYAEGGNVNSAGNYTKPELRKRIVSQVKSAATHGTGAGQWSARKAQLVAKKYKAAGGGYK
jgi:hypothetical protein